MNILMHMELSQTIRKAIEKELDVKIDRIRFIYGNIKPDLRPNLLNIPHYKDSAKEFVMGEIEKLASSQLQTSRKWSKDLSERMGVITHYLSDFFCYAHSEHFQGDLVRHLFYESHLWYYFQSHPLTVSYSRRIQSSEIRSSAEDIFNYLEDAHHRYLDLIRDKHPPYKEDTVEAVRVCVIVCISILSICLENLTAKGEFSHENSVFYGYLSSANQRS